MFHFRFRRFLPLFAMVWLSMACLSSNASAQEPLYQTTNSLQLIELSKQSYVLFDKPRAGLLILMATARMSIDKEVYPPVGQGGNSPIQPLYLLISMMSKPMLESVRNDPENAKVVLEKLEEWEPQVGKGYYPGWEYKHIVDEEQRDKIVEKYKSAVVESIRKRVNLLSDPEVAKAAEIVSRYRESERQYQRARMVLGSVDAIPAEIKRRYDSAKRENDDAMEVMWKGQWELDPEDHWHHKVGWKAEDYFDDPQVIKLCQAIAANDLEEMRRLIDAGADVKAIGKDGMTPLLWSFPDRLVERFELLLEKGADPNIPIQSDFGAKYEAWHPHPQGEPVSRHNSGLRPGQCVTLLAAKSTITDYFVAVMKYGGDANFTDPDSKETILHTVLGYGKPDAEKRVQILLDHEVELVTDKSDSRSFPLCEAIDYDHYDAAHRLLDSGRINVQDYPASQRQRLAKQVVQMEDTIAAENGVYQSLDKRIEPLIPEEVKKARELRDQKASQPEENSPKNAIERWKEREK